MCGLWSRPDASDMMKPTVLLRKLNALEGGDLWALIPATASLLLTRVALHLLPFRTILRWAEVPVRDGGSCGPIDRATWRRLQALERGGHGLFPRNPCLTQAVVAHRMLRKQGIPSELRIGVRRTTQAPLEAHAWVEHQGEILIGGRGLADDHIPLSPFRR